MNPEQKTSTSQTLVTLVLILVLIALVGGYIYYGMYQARQQTVVEEPTTEGVTQTDDERRTMILDQLSKDAPTSIDAEAEQKIITELENDNAQVDEEKRMEIIKALGQ